MSSIQDMISEAWSLFDNKRYDDSRAVYNECYSMLDKDDVLLESSILMGLIYVESFSENFDKAREYANKLVGMAQSNEDRHIYLHQLGMVERMAQNYDTALSIFCDEESIILEYFPDDYGSLSANMYEQGYVMSKKGICDEATRLMDRAISFAEKSEVPMCEGCAYRGMGEIYVVAGEKNTAKEYFMKAIQSFTKAEDQIAVNEIKDMINQL